MKPLYAITDQMLRLNDLLEEVEGDLSRLGEREEAVSLLLSELEADQGVKLDNLLDLARQLEMEAVAAKAEAEQWAAKAKTRQARSEYLLGIVKQHLTATGQPKVRTATGRTVAVVANGGQPPVQLAEAIDPAAVPEEFVRVKKEIDMQRVRLFLESGGRLAFATLGERGNHLRVR